ncbi:helicase-related protein [Micromonospora globispora]|uniref:helicase-related protein n=1 Tax=Micromonospora globispora TaxID=1450148 RepID=UPI000F5DBA5D|nr:helicase-related protein [Micromonospora globispora]RQW84071.1 helicase [Micromonospora globispora]
MPEPRTFARLREDVVTYLRRQYLGPENDESEVLKDRPDRVYLVGTLYPRGPAAQPLDGEILGDDGHEEGLDEPIELANAWHPASAAISFLHDGAEITVLLSAARYERLADETGWRRLPLTEAPIVLDPQTDPVACFDGAARLRAEWRRTGDAWLVTVAVENSARHDNAESPPPTEDCLFQVRIVCTVESGQVRPYPSVTLLSDDQEDEELQLLYRHRQVYGVGHGCSVTWDALPDGTVRTVATEMLPRSIVPGVSPGSRGSAVLRLAYLADQTVPTARLVEALDAFIDAYDEWVEARHKEAPTLGAHHSDAASRLLTRMDTARARMREGVRVLAKNGNELVAFRLANKAMREQILQTRHAKVAPGRRNQPLVERPSEMSEPAWYPFQLAFQLLTIASTANSKHEDRGVVDLIWFPTGGGKTEAYLALAAFEMIHRRLIRGHHGGGTAVLTRYTLRMLTAQQFQRAATLICALERMRQKDDRLAGKAPFSIGLWVGGETTPNRFEEAHALTRELRRASEPDNPFQINNCPWCATPLLPAQRTRDHGAYGVRSTRHTFELFCPHTECPFHQELPVRVVDQQIFADPPTLLVATVDKFARMPWHNEAGVVLGRDNSPYDPPGLVIQDELHLLSGPLGTTVALYEAAVLGLIGWNGTRAKVVASTATIRSAPEQVRRLYGSEVALFPPSGLDADDSYFAAVDRESPGRMYVGLMPQAHTQSRATGLAAVALLEAPMLVREQPSDLDAYWTVVAYHNSLRELGRTVTIARDDIESMLTARASMREKNSRRIRRDGVVELTSNVPPSALIKRLARLERRVDHGDAIDLVATTNMLSVGIDISRLGLMLMNGQPKTTSEYIQATSRVGRSDVPGLVVTLLRAGKPRDRSHYESFRAFHESLYRHVEPTSVTPWSAASRQRSLHAALVMLVRHGAGLRFNDDASQFRATDAPVAKAVRILLDAVTECEPEAAEDTRVELQRLVNEWERKARRAEELGLNLRYDSSDNEHPVLLCDFGERRDAWPTMHSMRSVDRTVRVIALGEA